MSVGAGKYDEEATKLREQTQAHGVLLLILGGNKGSGFSVQVDARVPPEAIVMALRGAAEEIEKDFLRLRES